MNAALDALSRKWYVAAAIFAIGVVVALAAYLDNAAGLISYRATSQLSISNVAISGVQLPCTPSNAAAVAKYAPQAPDAATKPAPKNISADLPAANILAVHYSSADPVSAAANAQDAAKNLAHYCNTATAAALKATTDALTAQLSVFQQQLGPLDTHVAASKDRAALVAQSDALNTKLIPLNAALSTAQTQLAAAIPIARSEIEQADPTFVQLQKRLNADLLTYAQVASEYRSTYARVIGLANRVTVDRQQLEARRNELLGVPLEQSATYRTAQTAANQAQTAVDVANKQLADLHARIAHDNKILSQAPSTGTSSTLSQQAVAAAYEQTAEAGAKLQVQRAQIPPDGPVAILSTPTADEAVEVGRLRAAAFSLALALVFLLAGVLLAVLAGLLDRRLLTTAQFTKLYGKPVIATVLPKK